MVDIVLCTYISKVYPGYVTGVYDQYHSYANRFTKDKAIVLSHILHVELLYLGCQKCLTNEHLKIASLYVLYCRHHYFSSIPQYKRD